MIAQLIASSLSVAVLGSCGNTNYSSKEFPDFGAAVAASTMHDARRACAIDGYDSIKSCAAAEKSQPSRLVARVALESQSTFTANCNETLGAHKCTDLLAQAYLFPAP